MPVTLVDRLPLPNLKVYSAGSVLLLSVAVYYAVNVTSDPSWKANATLQRPESSHEAEAVKMVPAMDSSNSTRNLTDQFAEVVTFLIQEPLCMWKMSNAEPIPGTSSSQRKRIPDPPSFLRSPMKKRPKRVVLRSNEKTTAINIYKLLMQIMTAYPYKTDVVDQVSQVMGISKATVKRILDEYKKNRKGVITENIPT